MSKGRFLSKKGMPNDHQTAPEDIEMVSIPRHILEDLLKGPQLLEEALRQTQTALELIRLTQREELEQLVGVWCPEKSEILFTACLDNVCKNLFEVDGIPIRDYAECLQECIIECISNTWDYEHKKGYRGKTEEQGISHARKRNLQVLALLSNMARLRNHKCWIRRR